MMSSNSARFALTVAFVLAAAYIAAAPPGTYHLIKKIPFGAAPGGTEYFDYITFDPSTRRVYLSHGTEVKVLEADSGKVLGTVTGFQRNHGIVPLNELSRGFVTDGNAGEVVVFDLKTFNVTGHIKAGGDPDSLLYDPASKHIFVFNGESKDVTVIDPATEKVLATIPVGGGPEQAVADGKGTIFDNIEDKNEVVVLDSQTNKIKARWPVAPAGQPVSMAMDRQHRRLFIGGRNPKMLVIMDADTGKIVGQPFPIGDRVDTNVYDPETGQIFASTREGTVHIFHQDTPDKFSLMETVKTEFGAKTMALDPKTHNIYVDTSDFDPPLAPTPQQPNPQPRAKAGTFRLLIYGR